MNSTLGLVQSMAALGCQCTASTAQGVGHHPCLACLSRERFVMGGTLQGHGRNVNLILETHPHGTQLASIAVLQMRGSLWAPNKGRRSGGGSRRHRQPEGCNKRGESHGGGVSFVEGRGGEQPVSTIAANDPTDSFPLNYDQVFIQDFMPSAVVFVLKGEYDIVRNFTHHTLLQLHVLHPFLEDAVFGYSLEEW